MKICDLLKSDKIITEIQSQDKTGAINELIDLFKDSDSVVDLEGFRKSVLEREKIMSTGVGKGFAVPHAKTNMVKEVVIAFGKTKAPIDFESLDGQPVQLIILLAAKENMVAPHIRLLSRISRMMNDDDFRKGLLEASTQEDILKLFCEKEKHLEGI